MQQCTCQVLARNNQDTIGQCLDSLIRPRIFQRILVFLDTKSTDSTGRILKAYSEKHPELEVLTYKWSNPPDFAAVRNHGISTMKTPYGFWVDSDEVLSKPEELRNMLSRAHGQAFQMWVISPVQGGFHNMYQPRLFPVAPGVKFECPVFERIDWSLTRCGIQIEKTKDAPIWHGGYTSIPELEKKNKRNKKILAKYLAEHLTDDVQRQHLESQYRKL